MNPHGHTYDATILIVGSRVARRHPYRIKAPAISSIDLLGDRKAFAEIAATKRRQPCVLRTHAGHDHSYFLYPLLPKITCVGTPNDCTTIDVRRTGRGKHDRTFSLFDSFAGGLLGGPIMPSGRRPKQWHLVTKNHCISAARIAFVRN